MASRNIGEGTFDVRQAWLLWAEVFLHPLVTIGYIPHVWALAHVFEAYR